jgi:hypothetical protein
MRKPIVLILLTLTVALPVFGQWQGDTRISNTSSSSYITYYAGRSIAADNSNVFITWYDNTSGSNGIRCMRFPIGTTPTAGAGTQVYTSNYYPCIGAGDGTRAHIAWYTSYYIYVQEFDGTTWGAPAEVSPYGHYYPAIHDDQAGNTYFVTRDRSNYPTTYRVGFRRKAAGGAWDPFGYVWDPGSAYHYFPYSDVCTTPNGDIHVATGVYRSSGPSYIVSHEWSTNNGSTWSQEDLGPDHHAYHTYAPEICSDKDGTIYIAHMTYSSPRQINVWRKTDGGSMEGPVNVSNAPNTVYYPSIAADTFGNVWVTWDDNRGGVYEVYCNRLPAGSDFFSGWEGAVAISDNDGEESRYSSIVADQNGNVHVAWRDRRDYASGSYEIYYDYYLGSGGGPPPPPDSLDLIMEQILRPYPEEQADVSFTPACLIWQNLEDTTIDAEVVCRINDLTEMKNVYEDILGTYPLEPGYNEVTAFKDFTPEGNKEYEATFVVNHPDDINVMNNDKDLRFSAEAKARVNPITIIAPDMGGTIDKMSPAANFKNVGSEEATNFYCYCEILPEGEYFTADYIDSVAVASLAPEAETDITFAEWVCDDNSSYVARFFAAIPGAGRELIGEEEMVNFLGIPYEGIDEANMIFALHDITPNPFSHSTEVNFSLANASTVSIKIYDVSGKLVQTLTDETFSAGLHSVSWNAENIAPGVYFVKYVTPEFSAVKKTLVLN